MLKKTLAALAIGTALLSAGQVMAADYKIDKEGQHAFIDWKISHLGYSYIHGTFAVVLDVAFKSFADARQLLVTGIDRRQRRSFGFNQATGYWSVSRRCKRCQMNR